MDEIERGEQELEDLENDLFQLDYIESMVIHDSETACPAEIKYGDPRAFMYRKSYIIEDIENFKFSRTV